jgi:GAF domain-containing protein
MKIAAKPANENARLAALRSFHILDTPAEKTFDDLVRLASYICQTPVAMVSFVDRDRQWFKAKVGVEAQETARDLAFCAHAILTPEDLLIVPDATLDERFADNPLVTDAPRIRFYAGAPLVTEGGFALGTLCVVDHSPKELSPEQIKALTVLRNLVIRELELHKKNLELTETVNKLEQAKSELSKGELRYRELVHAIRKAIAPADEPS